MSSKSYLYSQIGSLLFRMASKSLILLIDRFADEFALLEKLSITDGSGVLETTTDSKLSNRIEIERAWIFRGLCFLRPSMKLFSFVDFPFIVIFDFSSVILRTVLFNFGSVNGRFAGLRWCIHSHKFGIQTFNVFRTEFLFG